MSIPYFPIVSSEIVTELPNSEKNKRILENYNVKEIIGSGRFGTVAKIHDRVLNKDFALKKVPVYTTIQTIQAFKEGKNHRSFRHPNIVLLVGAWASQKDKFPKIPTNPNPMSDSSGSDSTKRETSSERSSYEENPSGFFYYMLELCSSSLRNELDGLNLKKNYETKSWKHSHYIRKIIRGIITGVMYLHEQGLMHRDLKPENILLDSKRIPKIADFGMIKKENKFGDKGHTPGCGTFLYISPEQKTGTNYDHKTDIYAVGVIGIELFLFKSTVMEIQKCIEGKVTLDSKMTLFPDLFLEMTSRDPNERPEMKEILAIMRKGLAKYFLRKRPSIKRSQTF